MCEYPKFCEHPLFTKPLCGYFFFKLYCLRSVTRWQHLSDFSLCQLAALFIGENMQHMLADTL